MAITSAQLEAAERDVTDLGLIVNGAVDLNGDGTVPTRLGGDVKTVSRAVADIAASQPLWLPPVAHANGLTVNSLYFTVSYNGSIYAPQPSAVPFTTTGTFDASKWYLVAFRRTNTYYASDALIPNNGLTDATAALNALHVAAGAGAVIEYEPGATYLTSASVNTIASQIVRFNGATLKRRNQIIQTTTSAIVSGVTTVISLDDASSFEAGMQLAFANGSVARGSLVLGTNLTDVVTIVSKGGVGNNDITVTPAPNANIPIGGKAFLAFTQFLMADKVKAEDVSFDGNKSNWSFVRWENGGEISTMSTSTKNTITRGKIANAPGEGSIFYGDDLLAWRIEFTNIGGNAAHFSGCVRGRLKNCSGSNGNQDVDIGHQSAFATFSNSNVGVTVEECNVDTFTALAAEINDTDSWITIDNNDGTNLYCHGVEGGGSTHHLRVTRNRIKGVGTNLAKRPGLTYYGAFCFTGLSGDVYDIKENEAEDVTSGSTIYALAVSSSGGTNFAITGNEKLDGKVDVVGLSKFEFAQNKSTGRMTISGPLSGGKFHHNRVELSSTGNIAVRFNASNPYDEVEFTDNTIIGETFGIDIAAAATAYRGFHVDNNRFYNQVSKGIMFNGFSGSASAFLDVTLSGNKVRTGAQSATDYIGIQLAADKVSALGNTVENDLVASSRIGVYCSGASTPKTVLRGTSVRGNWMDTIQATNNSGIRILDSYLEGEDVTNQTGNTVLRTEI